MTDDLKKQLVNEVKNRLMSLHNIDTSGLDDSEMIIRIAMLKDIMDNKDMGVDQVLAEYGD